jgi:hypothetical protein
VFAIAAKPPAHQLGRRVPVARRRTRGSEIFAQPGWREVELFHNRHGPAQAPCDQLRGESVLPVIADDLVPFGQQVGDPG